MSISIWRPGVLAFLLALALPGVPDVWASGVDLKLTCVPSRGSEGIPNRHVGQGMGVAVELSNDSCYETFDYGSVTVSMLGNGGDTLANLGLYGPYKRLNSGTVPLASCTPYGYCSAPQVNVGNNCSFDADCDSAGGDGVCDIYGQMRDAPSTVTDVVSVTDSVPAVFEGTVAAVVVTVDIQDQNGKTSEERAYCKVNVVP